MYTHPTYSNHNYVFYEDILLLYPSIQADVGTLNSNSVKAALSEVNVIQWLKLSADLVNT